MTATQELRRLLDERGVEYDVRDGDAIKNTYWNDTEGRRWGYTSDESGAIKDRQLFLVRGRMDITPQQAINATLGRGACHNAMPLLSSGMPYPDSWMCSECWGRLDGIILEIGNYCPNCGRKVVNA